jgi:hypothetical protein
LVAFVERSRKNISIVSGSQGCSDSVEKAHFTIGIAELSISEFLSTRRRRLGDPNSNIEALASSRERPFFEGSFPKDSQWGVTRHRSGHTLNRPYVQRRHAAVTMGCSRTGQDGGERKGFFGGGLAVEGRLQLQSKADDDAEGRNLKMRGEDIREVWYAEFERERKGKVRPWPQVGIHVK